MIKPLPSPESASTQAGGLSPLSPTPLDPPTRCTQLHSPSIDGGGRQSRGEGTSEPRDPQDGNALEAGAPSGRWTRGVSRPPPSASLPSAGGGRLHGSSPAAHQRASHSASPATSTALSRPAQSALKQVSFDLRRGGGERRTWKRLPAIPGSQRDQGWAGRPRHDAGYNGAPTAQGGNGDPSASARVLPAGGPQEATLALDCPD